ncbi:MAG: hypothetical protein IKK83_05625 [Clostridia bacterium]|nr:hypothetical protein [Clostridia bacterium]
MKYVTTIKEEFIEKAKKISAESYYYGNEILYKMCRDQSILPESINEKETLNRFESALLIIGKTYSASPDRGSGIRIADGRGTFFSTLAREIVENKDYPSFRSLLLRLMNEKYSFANDGNDVNILEDTVRCVDVFNRLIMESIGKMRRDNGVQNQKPIKNCVSFASKFLHFMVPHVFFIKDTISFTHGTRLLGKKGSLLSFCCETRFCLNYVALSENEHGSKTSCANKETVELNIRDYCYHVQRAYQLAYFLSKNEIECVAQIKDDDNSRYITRLVDSILMQEIISA